MRLTNDGGSIHIAACVGKQVDGCIGHFLDRAPSAGRNGSHEILALFRPHQPLRTLGCSDRPRCDDIRRDATRPKFNGGARGQIINPGLGCAAVRYQRRASVMKSRADKDNSATGAGGRSCRGNLSQF